ncbi:MAG: hypothetical protein ACU833_03690 [Gammaproteobacteria bacterium]
MACDHVKALKLARQGKWDQAHEMVQPFYDEWSCLVHGYLHRLEGDLGNASYWYVRAGSILPANSLEQEWQRLYTLVGGNKSE